MKPEYTEQDVRTAFAFGRMTEWLEAYAINNGLPVKETAFQIGQMFLSGGAVIPQHEPEVEVEEVTTHAPRGPYAPRLHGATRAAKIKKAQAMRNAGASYREIGDAIGLTPGSVHRYLNPERYMVSKKTTKSVSSKASKAMLTNLAKARAAKAARRANGAVKEVVHVTSQANSAVREAMEAYKEAVRTEPESVAN